MHLLTVNHAFYAFEHNNVNKHIIRTYKVLKKKNWNLYVRISSEYLALTAPTWKQAEAVVSTFCGFVDSILRNRFAF